MLPLAAVAVSEKQSSRSRSAGRAMDSHVAGVCWSFQSPVPGFWALHGSETAPSLCITGRPDPGTALVVSTPCRLRLVESYRGLTAGLRSLLHPRQAWGSFAQDDLIYLRSSSVTPSLEAWLRSDLRGPSGHVVAEWGLRPQPLVRKHGSPENMLPGAPDLSSEEAEPCPDGWPQG